MSEVISREAAKTRRNPTPFVLAEDAKPYLTTDGLWRLPCRVYIADGRTPVIVIDRRSRGFRQYRGQHFIFGHQPSSGFSGILLDSEGRYAGSIRRNLILRGFAASRETPLPSPLRGSSLSPEGARVASGQTNV